LSIDISGIIGTVIGLGGFAFGIISYFRNELERRKQTIFPLIEEFNTDKKLFIAKSLLDNYSFRRDVLARFPFTNDFDLPDDVSDESYIEKGSTMAEGNESIAEYENPTDLRQVLRNHRDRDVTAPEEIAIRMSFDSLLDFFVKLEYLLSLRLIKRSEIEYFEYYINKAVGNAAVVSYMNTYKFPLKGKLDTPLKVISPS
jgi:hypothetical protein